MYMMSFIFYIINIYVQVFFFFKVKINTNIQDFWGMFILVRIIQILLIVKLAQASGKLKSPRHLLIHFNSTLAEKCKQQFSLHTYQKWDLWAPTMAQGHKVDFQNSPLKVKCGSTGTCSESLHQGSGDRLSPWECCIATRAYLSEPQIPVKDSQKSCFNFLTIVNKAAMNLGEQAHLHQDIPLGICSGVE